MSTRWGGFNWGTNIINFYKGCLENTEILAVKQVRKSNLNKIKQNPQKTCANYTSDFLLCAQSTVYDYWGLDTTLLIWKERSRTARQLFPSSSQCVTSRVGGRYKLQMNALEESVHPFLKDSAGWGVLRGAGRPHSTQHLKQVHLIKELAMRG